MNILYINHYAGSTTHGMEYRTYYLAREWVRLGHNVTIVAADYSHIRTINPQLSKQQNYLYETIDGINYIWCKTPEYPVNGIRRVINIFTFLYRLKKLSTKLIEEYKPDLVIASSTYPLDTKPAYKIAKKTKAKFIYEVHDLWPLTPMELGGMSKYHPFIWLMQRAEDFGYRMADKVISLLPMARDYMQEHGMNPNKFVYIPNGVSVSDWQQLKVPLSTDMLDSIARIKEEYHFLIAYAGGMGESNALDYLLSAAKELQEIDVAFVLVGDGACKDILRQRLINERISNVYFLPRIDKTQVPSFLDKMDALYIGWHKLPIYRFGICPNKLFDYMLAAKPIIHSVTAGNDLVRDAMCGISVAAEDIGAIKMAVNEVRLLTYEQRRELGGNGHTYVLKHHDYKVLASNFLSAI